MSRKKNHKEALRWLKTGKSDLEAAGLTCYPNGLPDITPDMAYMEDDSSLSIAAAKKIMEVVESIIASETKNDA